MRTLAMLLVMAMVALGCSHNQTTLDAEGNIKQVTSPANAARMGPDGTLTASQHGLGATLLMQDEKGNWSVMPGPVGVLSYIPETGQIFMVSPKDALMTGVEVTPNPAPGQPAFKAATISFNLSEPLKQHVAALAFALEAIQGMTQTEAEARIKQMEIAGDITAAIVELLLKYFIPTLPE